MPQPSDPWTLGWEAIAAMGTASAALLAVAAIIISARAAKASARAAEAAEDQLIAQTIPVVVEVPHGGYLPQEEMLRFPDGREIASPRAGQVIFSALDDASEPARCYVPIQNVGPGLAQVTEAFLDFGSAGRVDFLQPSEADPSTRPGLQLTVSRARPTALYLPSNGREGLATTVSPEESVWPLMRDAARGPQIVDVRIRFTDVTGDQRFETLLHLRQAVHETSWRALRQATRKLP